MEQEYIELYRHARRALENAYAPYSGFQVGAALLTKNGHVFTGVNVENASYGAAICAERTACVKAVSEGEREFTAIATASSRGAAPMCGICRQFLSEFSTDMKVITGDDENHLEVKTLAELLPENFVLQHRTEGE